MAKEEHKDGESDLVALALSFESGVRLDLITPDVKYLICGGRVHSATKINNYKAAVKGAIDDIKKEALNAKNSKEYNIQILRISYLNKIQ